MQVAFLPNNLLHQYCRLHGTRFPLPNKTILCCNWQVSQTDNIQSFIVQYSIDGINWKNLDELTVTGKLSYNYIHTTPVEGVNYYVNSDGRRGGSNNYTSVKEGLHAKQIDDFILVGQ